MLSPFAPPLGERFIGWLDRKDGEGDIFLSSVTVHEIEKGIALLDHKGATVKAATLRGWLSGLIEVYGDKILSLDARAAALSGRLEAVALATGHAPGMADASVAGIAQAQDLIVVTRNTKHFMPFCIKVVSPEEACADSDITRS